MPVFVRVLVLTLDMLLASCGGGAARSQAVVGSGAYPRAFEEATATPTMAITTTAQPPVSTATPMPSPAETVAFTATVTAALAPPATTPPTPDRPTATVTPSPAPAWSIRSIDTMKLSRDTFKAQLSDSQIAAIIRLDARLHLTHVSVDAYFDDPAYLGRWVRAVRRAHLHVWFRGHWYAWETHRESFGDMTPSTYIEATRAFLQQHADLVENGDIFDFCSEPENGAYWLDHYGTGWSWRSSAAKTAFNTFIRSGVFMASTTLANRGRGDVLATAISVNESVATRLLSQPTVTRLGMITLDLYPEGTTTDPGTATTRVIEELDRVHRRWNVPLLIGEHGYSRDMLVTDAVQARVLKAEFAAIERRSYIVGSNYWVDAGGPGFGGFTNLYTLHQKTWVPRAAAAVLDAAYAAMSRPRR